MLGLDGDGDDAAVAPLDGIVVADFSRVLAGPLATMTLADLGAHVIKVERPGTGDDTRAWGPPYAPSGMTTYFESVNRGKKSVVLDLHDPADHARAEELIARSDVVIENFRPGEFARLGFGAEALRARHPHVVIVSISGFGSAGGADLPGYDFVAQAVGGLMHVTGASDGEAMKVGVALVDVLTGKDAVIGVLAALRRREATGEGSLVEVNLLSSLQGGLVNQAAAHLGAGIEPGRLGNRHPSIAPYEALRCADAPLAVACGNDAQFARMAAVLRAAELTADPRFATNADRVRHRLELAALLEDKLRAETAATWAERLNAVGVAAGVVSTVGAGIALAEDLGLHPVIDTVGDDGRVSRQIRMPITWTPPSPGAPSAPPRLGEHTAEVLSWLDDTPEEHR